MVISFFYISVFKFTYQLPEHRERQTPKGFPGESFLQKEHNKLFEIQICLYFHVLYSMKLPTINPKRKISKHSSWFHLSFPVHFWQRENHWIQSGNIWGRHNYYKAAIEQIRRKDWCHPVPSHFRAKEAVTAQLQFGCREEAGGLVPSDNHWDL